MIAARSIPLGGGTPRFVIRYVPEVLHDLADHWNGDAIMDEVEDVLARDPHRPPGNRVKALKDWRPLRRYRPHADNDVRVYFAVDGDVVRILGLYPRSDDYREKDLRAAMDRLKRARTQP